MIIYGTINRFHIRFIEQFNMDGNQWLSVKKQKRQLGLSLNLLRMRDPEDTAQQLSFGAKCLFTKISSLYLGWQILPHVHPVRCWLLFLVLGEYAQWVY